MRFLALSATAFWAVLVLGFATSSMAQTAAAPTTKSGTLPSPVLLSDGEEHYALGPKSYITRDDAGRTPYRDLIAGHLGGRQGLTTDYNVIPLGSGGNAQWIIVSVRNQTQGTSRWVFSLGTHGDGRYGTYKQFFIYDHLSSRYLIYAMPDRAGVSPQKSSLPLNGSGIPFDLAPGTQALLAIYIVPEAGAPVSFAPQIMTEQAFWSAQRSLVSGTSMFRIILLATLGYFLGLLILRRSLTAIPFMMLLTAQGLLFEIQNTEPYSDFPFSSETTALLLSLVVFCGLTLSKVFMGIKGVVGRDGLIIYLLMIAGFVLDGIALFAVPETSILRPAILGLTPAVGIFFLCLHAIAQARIGKPAAGLFGLGWFFLLAGFAVSAMAMIGTLNARMIVVNAYWIGALLQCAVLIAASFISLWVTEQDAEKAEEEAGEDADSVSRIRQAKDSSENARLLKVIEHERSILQELRDRELQQTEDMRRARDDADMANRAKSAFLAVISHEIRTPMSGIMGMVRLLLDTTLSKDQRDYARTIQDSGDAMLALLNDILDFEKIESGKMDLEILDFDLPRLVNDIMTLMSGHASQKNIVLKADIGAEIPRFVRGDPVRLRQVLLNLTGNAIKFTGEGGVVLTLKQVPGDAPMKSGWIRLYFGIRDSGIGISKEAQKNLFNPFSQADNSISRKYGGSGLGLAICQRLIEAMGSKIAIDSNEGEGSTFFFTIMMEEGRAERIEDMPGAGLRQGQKPSRVLSILCVDDNEVNQKLLKEFVSRLGHTPTLAGSGEQALQLIQAGDFDMVLMDIQLPGISGMGATKAIRGLPEREKAATPVIALTGNVRDEDIRQCYAANMNGHLAKPIDPDKLRAQIEKVIAGTLDNPVSLEEARISTGTMQEIKISDEKPSASSALSFEDDDATAPGGQISSLQAYTMEMDRKPVPAFSDIELDEDSFAEAIAVAETAPPIEIDAYVFDHRMLDGLKGSMKPAELKDMVDGLTLKNDEIVVALQAATAMNDMEVIAARAHELKGMCGNFGLKELADLGAQIEKAARDNVPGGLSDIIATLPDANARSKAALDQWISS